MSCSGCNAVYIGETGCTLRTRMTQHRMDIRNIHDTPVAEHFSLSGHTPEVCVLDSTSDDMALRRIVEAKWIGLFKASRNRNVLNRDNGADILPL